MAPRIKRLQGDAGRTDRVEGRLGRTETARRIGVTRPTVGRMVTRGELHPTIDDDGVHWFSVGEVAEVAAARRVSTAASAADEVAARTFELFDKFTPLRDVVVRLRIGPERVLALHEQWRHLGGRRELWLKPEHQEELVGLLSNFATPAELVERARELGQRFQERYDEFEAERDSLDKQVGNLTGAIGEAAARDPDVAKMVSELRKALAPDVTDRLDAALNYFRERIVSSNGAP